MKTIEVLVKEHVLIKKTLDLFEKAAKGIGNDQRPSVEFFEKSLRFCKTFADKYHHYKEEYIMFGFLAQKHNGEIDAQIEAHRAQHEQCRNLIAKISEALPGYAKKQNEPSRALHRNLSDYYQTLRKHIHVEDKVFFPMVDKVTTDEDDNNLLKQFADYEAKVGANAENEYTKLVDELSAMV